LRSELGLSQEGLAERAGLHRNYIGGIERGERNVAILNVVKLATALNVSLAELFAPFNRPPKRHSAGRKA
jgi:transcriptional regulator with XRE-family HTH domain